MIKKSGLWTFNFKNNKQKNKTTIHTDFGENQSSQFIIIMGVTLAIAVVLMTYTSVEISDLDLSVSMDCASHLMPQYIYIRETFGTSLNFNLVSEISDGIMYGNIQNIHAAFNKTEKEYIALEFYHGILIDATLNSWWFSHFTTEGYHVYNVNVTLDVYDLKNRIQEDVMYSIICASPIAT